MSDRVKIKEMKVCLELTPELRQQLANLASGACNEVYLDCVYFNHLHIEKIKCDGLKVEDVKLKKGKIKCFKIKAVEPEC